MPGMGTRTSSELLIKGPGHRRCRLHSCLGQRASCGQSHGSQSAPLPSHFLRGLRSHTEGMAGAGALDWLVCTRGTRMGELGTIPWNWPPLGEALPAGSARPPV